VRKEVEFNLLTLPVRILETTCSNTCWGTG